MEWKLWLYTAGIRLGLQQTRCRPATERPDESWQTGSEQILLQSTAVCCGCSVCWNFSNSHFFRMREICIMPTGTHLFSIYSQIRESWNLWKSWKKEKSVSESGQTWLHTFSTENWKQLVWHHILILLLPAKKRGQRNHIIISLISVPKKPVFRQSSVHSSVII